MRRSRRRRWLIAGLVLVSVVLLATRLAGLVVLAGIGAGLFYGGRALLRHTWSQPAVNGQRHAYGVLGPNAPTNSDPCLRCGRLRLDHVFSGGQYLCSIIGEQTIVHEAQWPEPTGEQNPRRIPQDVRIAVAARDGGKCRMCGELGEEFDHVIPWSKGGASTVANVQLLCGPHNSQKGARV